MNTSVLPSDKSLFESHIADAVLAESEAIRIIPQVLGSVWSSELSRTLRQVMHLSQSHHKELTGQYQAVVLPQTSIWAELEEQMLTTSLSGQKGSLRDIALTLLAAKVTQQKRACYERLLKCCHGDNTGQGHRMFGAAISDEYATELFLQELSERFVLREFSQAPD